MSPRFDAVKIVAAPAVLRRHRCAVSDDFGDAGADPEAASAVTSAGSMGGRKWMWMVFGVMRAEPLRMIS